MLSSDNKSFCFGDTLGNVRDAYRSFPALLFFNRVDWMKSLLNPIFEYCEVNIGKENTALRYWIISGCKQTNKSG